VKEVMDENDFKRYVNNPKLPNSKNSMSMIERFNFTMLSKIKKYMKRNETLKYYDVLDDLLENYNTPIHSTIKKKPLNVFSGKEYPHVEGLNIDIKKLNKFKVGDMIRAEKVRKVFDKRGFVPTYTLKTHAIVKFKNNKYQLENGKWYYEEQLIRANEDVNFEKFKKEIKIVNKEQKHDRHMQSELGTKDINQFIIPKKPRSRKPTQKVIDNII
jgi:hypothetical protein